MGDIIALDGSALKNGNSSIKSHPITGRINQCWYDNGEHITSRH